MKLFVIIVVLTTGSVGSLSQEAKPDALMERMNGLGESLGFTDSKLARGLNELMWWQRLQDVARIDKVRFTGPPNSYGGSPGTNKPGGTNEVIISAHTFLPRKP